MPHCLRNSCSCFLSCTAKVPIRCSAAFLPLLTEEHLLSRCFSVRYRSLKGASFWSHFSLLFFRGWVEAVQVISYVPTGFIVWGRKKSICVYPDILKLYMVFFFKSSLFHIENAKWGLSAITDTFPFISKDFRF